MGSALVQATYRDGTKADDTTAAAISPEGDPGRPGSHPPFPASPRDCAVPGRRSSRRRPPVFCLRPLRVRCPAWQPEAARPARPAEPPISWAPSPLPDNKPHFSSPSLPSQSAWPVGGQKVSLMRTFVSRRSAGRRKVRHAARDVFHSMRRAFSPRALRRALWGGGAQIARARTIVDNRIVCSRWRVGGGVRPPPKVRPSGGTVRFAAPAGKGASLTATSPASSGILWATEAAPPERGCT